MLKKILALILAAALLAAGTALSEQEAGVTDHDFLGEWVDQDGTCNIDIVRARDNEGFIANVRLDWEEEGREGYSVWAYALKYDGESHTMKSFFRAAGTGDYEPDSEETVEDIREEYFDAEFGFDADGKLTWSDSAESADDGMAFEHTIGWTDPDYVGPGHHFAGSWACGDVMLDIVERMDGYEVVVLRAQDQQSGSFWAYVCDYDDQSDTLVSREGDIASRISYVYDDQGEYSDETVYEDGRAVFSMNGDGTVAWQDLKENAGEGLAFVRTPAFGSLGEALADPGATGVMMGTEEYYAAVVEYQGAYLRVVAEMDDEARELQEAISAAESAEDIEKAFQAYDEHVAQLPVSYTEEITASPLTQEELDTLAGKTVAEIEAEGFEYSSSGSGEGENEAVYTVTSGMYDYELLLNETLDEYIAHEENDTLGELTVKSARLAGPSRHAAELRFHADGTEEPEEDAFGVFNAILQSMAEGVEAGEDMDSIMERLTAEMPEEAETISMLGEIFQAMAESDAFGTYLDDHPEAGVFNNTWVAMGGEWRIEVYPEDGGLKPMVVHKLGDHLQDVWEYAAVLEDGKLVSVPLGLHYQMDTATGDWPVTYYEDGDATFALDENARLVWNDLKEDAGKGLAFDPVGNFFGGRWRKDNLEAFFCDWENGEYTIRLTRRGDNDEILKSAILRGVYDADANTVTAAGGFEGEETMTVIFSYDGENRVVWTENGESTVMSYSYSAD